MFKMNMFLRVIIASSLIGCATVSLAEYTKVSNVGDSIPFSMVLGKNADDWACTYDSNTKLMWEVKTAGGGLHDAKWKYSWFNSDPKVNGGFEGLANGGKCSDANNCDTEKYVRQVNAQGLCGASDWRLPTLSELSSIRTVNNPQFFIADGSFEDTVDYWSATVSPSDPLKAWLASVNAQYRDNQEGHKNDPHFVRLVKNAKADFKITDFNLAEYKFAAAWPLNAPGNMAIALDGSLFAVDGQKQQIVHFKADGALINTFGKLGIDNGQFTAIGPIAVAPNGHVFVADQGSRVQQFKPDGTFVAAFGSKGSGDGQFLGLVGMAVAPDGTVYAVDKPLRELSPGHSANINRVQHFKADGAFISAAEFKPSDNFRVSGKDFSQIAVASDSSIYIFNHTTFWGTAATFVKEILHYSPDGALIDERLVCCASMTDPLFGDVGFAIAPDNSLFTFGNLGVSHYKPGLLNSFNNPALVYGQYKTPGGVAVSGDGTLYIADTGNDRIQKFVPNIPQYSYDGAKGIALFENITIDNEHYWVQLQNQGGFQFKVLKAYPVKPALEYKASVYEPLTGRVTLPKVIVDGLAYRVVLEHLNNGLLGVKSADRL